MSARKLGVGCACHDARSDADPSSGARRAPASRVWWTCVAEGLSEICFPTVDRPALRGIEVLAELADGRLVDPHARLVAVRRRERWTPDVSLVTAARGDGLRLVTEPLADPSADAIRVRWTVEAGRVGRSGHVGRPAARPVARPTALVVRVEPRLGGSGIGHEGRVDPDAVVVAWHGGLAVAASGPGQPGQRGTSGVRLTHVGSDGRLAFELRMPLGDDGVTELAIAFGDGVAAARAALDATLARTFDEIRAAELDGWHRWARSLPDDPTGSSVREAELGWESLVLFHVLEDATHRGAMVAAPARPWSDAGDDRDPLDLGYRHVWIRDLYHVALALLAVGDVAAFLRVADEGLPRLVREDGRVPQNAAVDGTPAWQVEQLDEVADAVLLAWWASRVDPARAPGRYERVIRPCADRLAALGPATRQERWEEQPGYSPSTLAAAIAALACAADAARGNTAGDIAGAAADAARWGTIADEWERSLDRWTLVPAGTIIPPRQDLDLPAWSPRSAETVERPFHLRIAPEGRPAAADTMRMADDGPTVDQRHVVDAGFLELARLGIREPGDPRVSASLDRTDADLRAPTRAGTFWYRYSGDRYGEREPGGTFPGAGHPWVHLAGERGHRELAAGRPREAARLLAGMCRAANEGGMLPEQVWDGSGRPTGAAAPLAWAHAELVLLRRSLLEGRVFDTPEPPRLRYLGR